MASPISGEDQVQEILEQEVMDDYEEYNYEDYEQDKTRKHGSKKGAAQHKEQSTSQDHTRKIATQLRNEEKNKQAEELKHPDKK